MSPATFEGEVLCWALPGPSQAWREFKGKRESHLQNLPPPNPLELQTLLRQATVPHPAVRMES